MTVINWNTMSQTHESTKISSCCDSMSAKSRESVTFYGWNGTEIDAGSLKERDVHHLDKFLETNNTITIGNGGAGHAGLIKHLAVVYNNDCDDVDQITIGWKFADSNMNFDAIKEGKSGGSACDLYITYEPVEEVALKEKKLLEDVIRLFNDEFPIIGPISNPAKLRPNLKPVENMAKIMQHGLTLKGPGETEKKIYFSRWNHSAMGVKDMQLWYEGSKELAEKILSKDDVKAFGFREDVESAITKELNKDLPKGEKTENISTIILKNFTDNHVQKPDLGQRLFPADAISAAKRNQLYGITDAALTAINDISDSSSEELSDSEESDDSEEGDIVVYNHASDSPELPRRAGNILTNPAQLLVPNGFKDRFTADTPQGKFFEWLTSKKGETAISEFKVETPGGEKAPYQPAKSTESIDMVLKTAQSTIIATKKIVVPQ